MSSSGPPIPDFGSVEIADYVLSFEIPCPLAHEAATYCLMDALSCGFQALKFPACTRLMGPVVPGATLTWGARVPGTSYELDPITAAFNIGVMIRWLDFNDPWLTSEWVQLSDSLAGILAVADYVSRNGRPVRVRDILTAMIGAHEIHGVLAKESGLNDVGLAHGPLVCVVSTAVLAAMLGGTRDHIVNAVSNAWMDAGASYTHRHAANTGARRAWVAGDAASRAVRHALFALRDEMGHSSARSAITSGVRRAPFVTHVPAEFQAHTPVLVKKFETSVAAHFRPKQTELIKQVFEDKAALGAMTVSEWVAKLVSAS